MKTVIAADVKLSIAVAALSNPALKTKELAAQFGCGETTVKRAKKDFADEAIKFLEAEKQKLQATVVADPMDHYRGFRPRNGRMSIIRAVIKELGKDAAASALYERVNELSNEAGLKTIKRTAVYVLMREEIAKLNA